MLPLGLARHLESALTREADAERECGAATARISSSDITEGILAVGDSVRWELPMRVPEETNKQKGRFEVCSDAGVKGGLR